MKIDIFGGSFNPPHLAHKKIATDLINNNYVDVVIFVPTSDKYHKKNLINSYYRINMLKEMIKDCDKLFISDYEVKDELKYTYETLKYFKEKFNNDDIYFICGADNLSYIDKWKNYEEILSKYKIIVLNRDNINVDFFINKYSKFNSIIKAPILLDSISSTMLRNSLDEKYLDNNVYKYIIENKLYNML